MQAARTAEGQGRMQALSEDLQNLHSVAVMLGWKPEWSKNLYKGIGSGADIFPSATGKSAMKAALVQPPATPAVCRPAEPAVPPAEADLQLPGLPSPGFAVEVEDGDSQHHGHPAAEVEDDAKLEVRVMQLQLREAQVELHAATLKVSELQHQQRTATDLVQKDLDQREAKIVQLQEEMEGLKTTNTALQVQLKAKEEEVAKLDHEIGNLQNEELEFQLGKQLDKEDLKTAEREKTALQAELNASIEKCTKLQQQSHAGKEECTELQTQLVDLQNQLSAKADAEKEHAIVVEKYKKNAAGLTQQLSAKTKEVALLNEELAAVKAALSKAEKAQQKASGVLDQLQKQRLQRTNSKEKEEK